MTTTELKVDAHPLLALEAFTTRLPRPLGDLPPPSELQALLAIDAPAPLASSDAIRSAVRDVLRAGGFKPTGRSKPASEYLLKAAREGTLPSINLAVDICNVVSLHSGLPISVVDLQCLHPPLHVAVAEPAASYVFNASGQVMDVAGLVCLHDAGGPCANAVKDSQRAKTSASTTSTLTVIWGARQLVDVLRAATQWYRELLAYYEATTEDVVLS